MAAPFRRHRVHFYGGSCYDVLARDDEEAIRKAEQRHIAAERSPADFIVERVEALPDVPPPTHCPYCLCDLRESQIMGMPDFCPRCEHCDSPNCDCKNCQRRRAKTTDRPADHKKFVTIKVLLRPSEIQTLKRIAKANNFKPRDREPGWKEFCGVIATVAIQDRIERESRVI